MDRFLYSSHGLGGTRSKQAGVLPSDDGLISEQGHFKTASVTPELRRKIEEMGLIRVAGNAYRCTSTKDFWKVQGGKVIRISVDEVDNGESIQAAPADTPGNFLSSILADLTF
jgi:hypothetical protein